MRGSKRCLLVAALGCLCTFCAAPCAALTLTVERGPGTAACPDETALAARVREVRGLEAEAASRVYLVRFKRVGGRLSAEIRVGETRVRALDTRTASCEVLAKGVAVTLAMLIDSDAAAELPKPPEPAQPAKPAKPAPPPAPEMPPPLPAVPSVRRAPRGAHHPPRGFLSVGASGLVGVLGPLDAAFTVEGGLRTGTVRLSLGALWAVPRRLDVAGGSVNESLVAGTLRACSGLLGDERLSLGVCVGAFAGELGGSARGFAAVEQHQRAWLVVPLEASLARFSGPIAWELSASGLVPLVQRDFGIAGAGVAYRTPAIGGLLALRGVIGLGRE